MKAVKLIDTSILCELLEIPGKSNKSTSRNIKARFRKMANDDVRFVLPLASIIETGNHIANAKNVDGQARRKKGLELMSFVIKSLDQYSPFLNTIFWERNDIEAWMKDFPDSAMRSKGLGDLSIEHDLQIVKSRLKLPSSMPVEIWSKDGHLA